MSSETLFTDHLTSAFSRTAFNYKFQEEYERAHRHQLSLGLLVVDLDHFKSVNDAFGHQRGDQVLIELVQRIKANIRLCDFVFRYGGDEFVLLLPHSNRDEAGRLAERLVEVVRAEPFGSETPLSLTISIGVASFPEDGLTSQELFEIADRRSYAAKQGGRSQAVSGDTSKLILPRLKPPLRLLEREKALVVVHEVFQRIQTYHQPAVLLINGPQGAGQSAFLKQAGQYARFQGFLVVSLNATPVLKMRQYGALNIGLKEYPQWPLPQQDEEAFIRALAQELMLKEFTGLCILVDQATELDPASQLLLQKLLQDNIFPNLALCYTTHDQAGSFELPVLGDVITLEPLSKGGLQIWLRHSLQGEAEASFMEWVFEATNGLPSLISQGLQILLENEILTFSTAGVTYHPFFEHFPLKSLLLPTGGNNLVAMLQGLPLLVGRDEEPEQIQHALQYNRLVSLIGAGGTGKTRLALQAAAEYQESKGPAVPETYFVALTAVNDANGLVTTIAASLGLQQGGALEPRNQLLNYLKPKNLLLVLDNFEQLLLETSASSLLSQILESAPAVRLLVTSREVLQLPGEKVVTLAGLSYPAPDATGDFGSYSAVQLFIQKARSLEENYEPLPEDKIELMRICRQVEGLPLGLIMAASWVQDLSLKEIVDRLEQNLANSGASGQSAITEQQKILRAVFESFWTLLSRWEQITLQSLALFKGGFTREAAREVADASLFFLRGLVAKTFLRCNPQGRYEMHELLRQFLAEKLAANPQQMQVILSNHSVFYLNFLKDREMSMYRGQTQAILEVMTEVDNLRQAWKQAVVEANCEYIYNSIWGFGAIYLLKSLPEGRQDVDLALNRLSSLVEQVPQVERFRLQKTIAGLLAYRAGFLNEMAMFKQTIADCQEAIALVETLDAPDITGAALYRWARALLWQQQHAEAIALFNKVVSVVDNAPGSGADNILLRLKGDSLRSIGISYYTQGLYDKAVEFSEAALAVNRGEGDRLSEVCVLGNLGEINMESGNYPQAKRYCEQAQQILQDIPFVLVKSQVITTLGRIHLHLGNYIEARPCFEQALELYRYMGSERFRAQGNFLLGLVYLLQGEYRTALVYARQALAIATEIGNRDWEVNTRLIIGQALIELEQFEEANQSYQYVLELYEKSGELVKKIEPLAGLARISLRAGDIEQARRCLDEILDLATHPRILFTNKFQPFLVYTICFEVLDAAKDPRRQQIQVWLRLAVEEKLRFTIEPETRQQIINQEYLKKVKRRKSFA